MRFEESLGAFLLANVPSSRGNVHPNRLPQTRVTGLAYVVGDGEDDQDQGGVTGLTTASVDIDCYGLTFEDAIAMGREVSAAFRAHSHLTNKPLVEDGPVTVVTKIGTPAVDFSDVARMHVCTVPLDVWFDDEDA